MVWKVLDGKPSQEYPVNAGIPQGSIFDRMFSLLYINDDTGDVIYNIVNYAHDTAVYSRCDRTSDLWLQLELVSELGSDLILVPFDQFDNYGTNENGLVCF